MSDIKQITQESFNNDIAKGTVLVDFYADWCGPCRMLTPVLEKIAKELKDQVTVVKLDIDKAQQVSSTLQITSIPTIILFKDNKEVGRIVGLRDFDEIKKFVLSS